MPEGQRTPRSFPRQGYRRHRRHPHHVLSYSPQPSEEDHVPCQQEEIMSDSLLAFSLTLFNERASADKNVSGAPFPVQLP